MWAILTKDSTDEFADLGSAIVDDRTDLHDVEFYDNYDEAKTMYDMIKGSISNVFLVEVIKSEVNI